MPGIDNRAILAIHLKQNSDPILLFQPFNEQHIHPDTNEWKKLLLLEDLLPRRYPKTADIRTHDLVSISDNISSANTCAPTLCPTNHRQTTNCRDNSYQCPYNYKQKGQWRIASFKTVVTMNRILLLLKVHKIHHRYRRTVSMSTSSPPCYWKLIFLFMLKFTLSLCIFYNHFLSLFFVFVHDQSLFT